MAVPSVVGSVLKWSQDSSSEQDRSHYFFPLQSRISRFHSKHWGNEAFEQQRLGFQLFPSWLMKMILSAEGSLQFKFFFFFSKTQSFPRIRKWDHSFDFSHQMGPSGLGLFCSRSDIFQGTSQPPERGRVLDAATSQGGQESRQGSSWP